MRVAVGISGGVDSAVAAALLREEGHDVIGVTMTLGRPGDGVSVPAARRLADRLDIPFELCDLAATWKAQVCGYVRETYLRGQTPNPCIFCNERVKFGIFADFCFENLQCDRFATGHYARLERTGTDPRGSDGDSMILGKGIHLLRGVDKKKDQSYFLYRVRPDVLAKTIFPLGGMTKQEVRAAARARGLAAGDSPDSQDFCGGDPMDLIGRPDCPGDVVTEDGRVLGEHRGYWHYTVGMRKGLGIGGGTPFYVLRLDAARNRVVVGPREAVVRHDLTLTDCVGTVDFNLPVKVRSAGEPRLLADGIAGVAPGQSAVFYRGDEVVGGGIIAV